MAHDRVSELQIEGMRTVVSARLRLSPLTVLTGENGSGKSTIVEACEIMRRAAEPKFLEDFLRVHGGLEALLSHGSNCIRLGLRIEGRGDPLEYSFTIEDIHGLAIGEEQLRVFPEKQAPHDVFSRSGRHARVLNTQSGVYVEEGRVPGAILLLTGFGLRIPHPAVSRTIRALEQIDVQLPFPVLPAWVVRTIGNVPSMRVSSLHQSADSLIRLGPNLANVYQALAAQRESWPTTMEYIRLGLGDDIESVTTRKTATGDGLEIWFKYLSFPEEVPARSLSDGTLDYLAFVAFFRLATKKSLVVFDEPESQLHPALATRVAQLFESMSRIETLLVATHSDRFLDALTKPAQSVVLCSLDENRATRLMRPEPAALQSWLENYRGLGDLRAVGHEPSVMTRPERP